MGPRNDNIQPPLSRTVPKGPILAGFQGVLFLRTSPLFPGPIPLAPSGPFSGTFGAVKCVVPGRGENLIALPAAPPSGGGRRKQGDAQLPVQRQDSGPEPTADQRVGNRLRTDTFLPIVQEQTISLVVVAAAMYQPPDSAILRVGQPDGVIGHARPSAGSGPP